MKLSLPASAVVAIALAMPAQLHAQALRPTGQDPAATVPLTHAERLSTEQFVNKAWNINEFEIQAAREAQNKKRLNDYAQMILKDHTKMGDDLKSAARNLRGAGLPTSLDAEHQQKLQQLKSGSAQDFDKQFLNQQIEGHREALRIFQAYASNGDNAELKSFAQNSVAMLQRHLDQAEKLSERPSGVM